MSGETIHWMIAEQSAWADVPNWRFELETWWRLGTVGIIRFLIVAEHIGEAVVLAFLNVIKLFRMVSHRSVLGVDQPTAVIPVETERIAIPARENKRLLLPLGGIEAKNCGGEFTAGKIRPAGYIGMGRFA